jgi:hypothetical protein
MQRRNLMISASMTPIEAKMGRYMRAPDHDASSAPMIEIDETPTNAPAVPAAPVGKTTDDLYDEEYGGTVEEASSEEPEVLELTEEVKEEAKPEAKPENDVQKRIDQLTAELRETQRQLAEASRPREQNSKPTGAEEPKGDGAPNPEDYDFGKADDKFIADWARWNADQRFNERAEQVRVEQQIEAIETSWKGALEAPEVVEAYPDFDEKVTKGADRQEWACSLPMAVLIKRSDVGPDIAYELASNPDESRRIASLSLEEQLLEFGRLEGRASALKGTARSAAPAPKKVPSSAPPPPANRSRGSGGKFANPQDALYDRMLSELN